MYGTINNDNIKCTNDECQPNHNDDNYDAATEYDLLTGAYYAACIYCASGNYDKHDHTEHYNFDGTLPIH